MARIRSIHAGLATDEAFMQMSAYAKAAWPLLWTQCDDQGVFEWKPPVLKARILPADAVDFADLLEEWLAFGCIMRFEVGGKPYGAVRNFGRFQRPKKPNSLYPLPNEVRTFVRLMKASSEPVPHQYGTDGENSAQMEDGGGRRERDTPSQDQNSECVVARGARDDDTTSDGSVLEKCLTAAALQRCKALEDLTEIHRWMDAGRDLDRDIIPILKARRPKDPSRVKTWRYFADPLREAFDRPAPAPLPPRGPRTYLVEPRGTEWMIEVGSPEYEVWARAGPVGCVRDYRGRSVIIRSARTPMLVAAE